MPKMESFARVDDYIDQFPEEVQYKLHTLRDCIQQAAPTATERMAYGIPTFWLGTNLVHFGGYAKHIGFYPGPGAIERFQEQLQGYKTAKGSIQFPLKSELPLDLVREMVLFRLFEISLQKKP